MAADVCEHTSGMILYFRGFGVCGVLTMWQFFCIIRNLIQNVILFLSGFLVVIKLKLGK